MSKLIIAASDPLLRHKLASGLLGAAAGITTHHLVERLYDVALEAYRERQRSKNK